MLALDDFNAAIRSGHEPAATHRSLGHLYKALDRPGRGIGSATAIAKSARVSG